MTTVRSTPPSPDVEQTSTDLAVIEQQLGTLFDPEQFADTIADDLQFLHVQGAHAATLDSIYSNAVALTETAQQLQQASGAAVRLAKSLREQRDATQTALENLRNAIRLVDTSDPLIEQLHSEIEEAVIEWQQMTWMDDMFEYVGDLAFDATGLEYTEISSLLDLLTGDGPAPESELWGELRDWIDRAEVAARGAD